MTSTRSFLIPSLVLAAALLGACGGDDDTASGDATQEVTEETSTSETTTSDTTAAVDPSEAPAVGGDVVTIAESRYEPEALEVDAGTEVTFENTDPYAHTVTSAEGSPIEFDSGEFGQGETFTHTFDEPGTYGYFCQIHPTMRAEVVVS